MKQLKILLAFIFLARTPTLPVWAQAKYSLKEITPVVQAALDGRRDRFNQLAALKTKGVVGENNRGYVEVVGSDPSAQSIVQAENKDRAVIDKTIAEQNGLMRQLDVIEKVFAQVQRDKAQAGEKIQNDSGQWVTK